jgi:outer membrane immunogenic protein
MVSEEGAGGWGKLYIMKRAVLGVASALMLAAPSAHAADMALKAPPPSVFSWTGLYLGIEGGGGWGREDYSDNSTVGFPPGVSISQSPSGGIFGGVLGYRYQTGQFVFGIEGTAG